jgi:hypothetical protein
MKRTSGWDGEWSTDFGRWNIRCMVDSRWYGFDLPWFGLRIIALTFEIIYSIYPSGTPRMIRSALNMCSSLSLYTFDGETPMKKEHSSGKHFPQNFSKVLFVWKACPPSYLSRNHF